MNRTVEYEIRIYDYQFIVYKVSKSDPEGVLPLVYFYIDVRNFYSQELIEVIENSLYYEHHCYIEILAWIKYNMKYVDCPSCDARIEVFYKKKV